MADTKISALTSASTPLAGTEVLPIVQSGSTVKVAVSNLTAGRDVNATSYQVGTRLKMNSTWIADAASPTGNDTGFAIGANRIFPCDSAGTVSNNVVALGSAAYPFSTIYTGDNIVIGTSGKGIDFSATPGTGTSELFNDYEIGTWTPAQGSGVTVVGTFSSSGTYTKIGRSVTVTGIMFGSTTIACTAGTQLTSNLPFANSPDGPLGQAITQNTGIYCPIYTSGVEIYTANTPLSSSGYIFFSLTYITA
jgi:hypothetical protein